MTFTDSVDKEVDELTTSRQWIGVVESLAWAYSQAWSFDWDTPGRGWLACFALLSVEHMAAVVGIFWVVMPCWALSHSLKSFQDVFALSVDGSNKKAFPSSAGIFSVAKLIYSASPRWVNLANRSRYLLNNTEDKHHHSLWNVYIFRNLARGTRVGWTCATIWPAGLLDTALHLN